MDRSLCQLSIGVPGDASNTDNHETADSQDKRHEKIGRETLVCAARKIVSVLPVAATLLVETMKKTLLKMFMKDTRRPAGKEEFSRKLTKNTKLEEFVLILSRFSKST